MIDRQDQITFDFMVSAYTSMGAGITQAEAEQVAREKVKAQYSDKISRTLLEVYLDMAEMEVQRFCSENAKFHNGGV
jgi:hypothetical protein